MGRIRFGMVVLLLVGCSRSGPVPRSFRPGTTFTIHEVVAAPSEKTETAKDPETGEPIYLVKPALVTTTDVVSIATEQSRNDPGQSSLVFTVSPVAGDRLMKATSIPGQTSLAVIVNGQVISVIPVHAPIGPEFRIAGNWEEEAVWQQVLQ